MATTSNSQAVKSLNTGPGRRRFTFKSFSQRIEEIDIDVYRSLNPLKAEPSEGSSFFRDCIIEYRELNTAEDFISFYEEMFPLVQTLPQIILQKELILSYLLSRLKMKGRLSLEPILRLIAALSRDLLEDFIPFLQRIADSLTSLLESGADREPEIIEQIFTSWSYILMYLQKYLIRQVGHVLSITVKLRYYPRDYVREFMAESVSFLLRKTPVQHLKRDIRNAMLEVAEEPSETRKSGVSSLLSHVMRITSSRLHSKTEMVLTLLLNSSFFENQSVEGSTTILEVLILTFQRLYAELDPEGLHSMWKCLCDKITDCVANGNSLHLSRLLSLLISTMQNDHAQKISDYKRMLQLVGLLLQTSVLPHLAVEVVDQSSEIIDKILKLMLCILDGLCNPNTKMDLMDLSSQWGPVFDLRNHSLLIFIRDLLLKDPCILRVFGTNILSAFSNLVEGPEDDVINLLLSFCEKMEGQSSAFYDVNSSENLSRLRVFLRECISYWIGVISNAIKGSNEIQENRLPVLWGVIGCYPHVAGAQENPSLLMNLIKAMDEFLMTEIDQGCIARRNAYQSLIGAALRSYHKLVFSNSTVYNEPVMSKFLDLAKRYKASPQILSSVANILDSVSGSIIRTELLAGKAIDVLDIFAENLCHAHKEIRLSTLRILCHYEPLNYETSMNEHLGANKMIVDGSEACHVDDQGNNVLKLLQSIEETPLSIATSRKVILLISKIQMGLSAGRVAEQYLPIVLHGIIGIFHNRFSYLWNPAMECLGVLLSQYLEILWDIYVRHLDNCQSIFLSSHKQSGRGRVDTQTNQCSDLAGQFNSFVFPSFDSTPCATVLSLLIQSLQKIPSIAESRNRQIIPLFLKFLGYNVDDLSSVTSHTIDHKGKDWKGVLKEWLSLFRLLPNPKAFYLSRFLKDVLQFRLLDDNDAELQMKVLDSLMNWKDEFLIPYDQHLKNLINTKNLREELTKWSLSRESNLIDVGHRTYVVPIAIRLLMPKVRKLKTLASQKNTSIHHRRAVLGFLAQLDVDELPLFFSILIRRLQTIPQGVDVASGTFFNLPESYKNEFDTSSVLRHFTMDAIKALSWKKRYGFLHVVEDILAVFDESRVTPFLDLLAGYIVQILANCTSSLESAKSTGSFVNNCPSFDNDMAEHVDEAEDLIQMRTSVKQFKELRSLCLKIIYLVLSKYEDHDFGCQFWDLFFTSVKPLISSFKQEGASSEKPSSLFSCFLAMSRSCRLLPLLYRERSLVPDIFSMLSITTASEFIVNSVFKFIKNLLKLDSELGDDDCSVKNIMLPHLDVLVGSLRSLFMDNASKRKLVKCPGKKELTVFKLLVKYVKEPSAAGAFVDILLPLLTLRPQSSDAYFATLQIIGQVAMVLGTGNGKKILNSVSPLLISADPVVRVAICDVLDALAASDSSVLVVAKLLRQLNATSAIEMGGLDYDRIISAYEKINSDFFYSVREEHALLLLSHSIHDMSSEELILRQSAFKLFLSFIEFAGEILNGMLKCDQEMWSEASIHRIVKDFILKHMGNAMVKGSSCQKVWMDLLREMVLKLPMVANLKSYEALHNSDPEQDFFNNIVHLQKHRRARALSRFRDIVGSGNLSEVITNKVLVPLLFSMLLDVQNGKDEHVKGACIDALASVSGCMKWKQYYALLNKCFREMTSKPDKQKLLLRLIIAILVQFHFSEVPSVCEVKDSACDVLDPYTIEMTSSITLRKCTSSAELPVIQTCLQKHLLPKIQNLLSFDSENVNVNISLVALKLLKLLPGEIMDAQLPNIIHRISNFLKNRLESVRDESRSALAACLKELGLEYLQFIVKVLKGILKRGYELHVLGYTLNFILSKFLLNPVCGKLDYCLEDLLSVIENDILGDVSEEKEVEKIASKMKETRKQKSYETLELIARSITFKTHVLKLLSPVTVHLQKHLTQKVKWKLEKMLNHIAAGIERNPSVNQTELIIFTYGLIEDGISNEHNEYENSYVSKASKLDRDEECRQLNNSNGLFSHLITAFALGLLQNYMKNLKLNKEDKDLLSMLDSCVSLLCKCLSSKYESIASAAIRCLSPLVRLHLPSLESQGDKIKISLLAIAQGSVNANTQSMESCIKLLTVLLRSTKVTLSADQLQMLIHFPLFVDLEKNASSVALSLLKAVVHRKLVVPEIYDLVVRVANLMVTSHLEPVRKKCSQILLQFLLDYRLSGKRLQQHLDLLLVNLRYEHSTGREAILEMLHAIIMKFPKVTLDKQSQTVFLHLVVCLANDQDSKVRSMAAAAIKCLITHVSLHSLHTILEYSLSWYQGEKQKLWGAAAQVLGLLVEVMSNGFEKHLTSVLQAMRRILQFAVTALTSEQDLSDGAVIPWWKEAYYSFIMFEKILDQLKFRNLCFDRDLEDIWETICEFLLHPHLWLRNISNRLVSFYFRVITETCNKNKEMPPEIFFLMRPSRLFSIAASLCCQLKVPLIDDAAGDLIVKNLVFSICGLHSLLVKNKYMNLPEFWSNLEPNEQDRFLEAFHALDSSKGRSSLLSITSGLVVQHDAKNDEHHQHLFVSYLLQRMGKISLQMEATQMKIVFNCFKLVSSALLDCYKMLAPVGKDDFHDYAFQMLFPLYKVCEGFTGTVISDDVKQLAQEVRDSIRDKVDKPGSPNFVQIYNQIRKILKGKRDKRKHEEKVMAVVNPMKNAKRKLRIAAKHRANKKRKIMTMKMGKWMR
ncbi:small subunit processome component 20 homolog [Olea europaea subsp. europaea]|uniref:Small subunit processome component 20 homolog n=1 Tax=Olea europaea subsp. europaea TaxID=158383 RepID=A0A8S0PBW1_OLEEU|nr:small subunit processome component 20 homolog [Olea europaea subsp. europaea]